MIKVLFVCLGNICRSPAAEGIMKSLVLQQNLQENISVDSAGTIGYHTGDSPDPRMLKQASERGFELNHKARKFNPTIDFMDFDYIVTMDDQNYIDVKNLDKKNKFLSKIYKIADFSSDPEVKTVPDPYYGGPEAFDNVIDILKDSCTNLLNKIKDDIK
jgi:protein-tyrosine phosphatase